ncbi:MAG TPA: GGDEF domain-containing protein, partial [Rhodanobacter sp.]|nr:GGDEF domain-containing protein [Rhodanobacter sp.]
MLRLPRRFWSWPALAGMILTVLMQPGHAATTIADPATFLHQTESLSTRDHPRFVQRLAQIQQEASRLTPDERWYLRYLDAWETMFEGHYTQSEAQLRDV